MFYQTKNLTFIEFSGPGDEVYAECVKGSMDFFTILCLKPPMCKLFILALNFYNVKFSEKVDNVIENWHIDMCCF